MLGPAWLIMGFAALLIVVSAVPVLAADAEVGIPSDPAVPVQPPGPAEVAEAAAAAEREEAAHERALETPAAQREQEESVEAYSGLGEQEARQLFLSAFATSLHYLDSDPARYLSDVLIVKTYGESVATISDNGDRSVLEANVPIRVEEEGELRKVDLDLEVTEKGFEPENPIVDLAVPKTAGGPIAIGDEGLSILPLGADNPGNQMGEQDVFYSEVHEDTDLLVAPIASGVEIFDQLRSGSSPEQLNYRLSLPSGAQLQPNGAGGANVIDDGGVSAYVAPPSAVDAQGTVVPVELEVSGETITLVVPHRDRGFTYPILVDPAIHENYEATWYWGSNVEALDKPGIWQLSGDPTMDYYLADTKCLPGSQLCAPSGRGLYIQAMDGTIPAGRYLQWYYTVPGGTTYIPSISPSPSAAINPFWRNDNSCGIEKHPQPHDYVGAFDAAGNWVWGPEINRARWYQHAVMYTKAKGIVFGLSTGGSLVNLPCNRDLMAGGVAVRLDDPEPPTLSSVTGFPTGWIRGNQPFTITANIYDPGLGVQNVKVYPTGRPPLTYVSEGSECPGTKTNPCPYSRNAQFSLAEGLFDEGEKQVHVSGYDPTGGVEGTSNTISRTVRVDRSAPTITLTGSLARATKENRPEDEDPEKWDELSRPFYSLHIEAKDGSNDSPTDKRSGVKRVEIYLDGKLAVDPPWSVPSCASSCEISKTYDLQLASFETGQHTLKVVAFDWLEQSRERTIEFEYFPATGDKPEYAMERFPLPDGTDPEAAGAMPWPEISVNVATGNVLFEQRDVDIEGPAVDLEVERVYNSLLPPQEDTEWGDGWRSAQTPDLEPVDTGGTPAPDQAAVLDSSGTIEDEVALPSEAGAVAFDPGLQATITKHGSGFALEDETGGSEGSIVFDSSGRAQQFFAAGDAEAATVDYAYEEGELSEIAVDDPASSSQPPAEPPAVPVEGKPTFVKNFGSGFSNAGVARDAEGNVWMVKKSLGSIFKYGSSGEGLGVLDSQLTTISKAVAIAVDSKGNLLVADAGKSNVAVVSPQGVLKQTIGGPGTDDGQFTSPGPEGVAVDRKGNIWVTDTYAGRIQKFTAAGNFVAAYGSKGSGPGQLLEPRGIDVGPDGEVWVADWGNNRVAVFEESGAFVENFGTGGTADGEFSHPVAIDFDNRGVGWVVDEGNGRVQGFVDGAFYWKFGQSGTGSGRFSFRKPSGLATDAAGRFWIVDTGNLRLQKWETPNYAPEYAPALGGSFGASGAGEGYFNRPADVAVAPNGDLWVADSNNNRIQKFSPSGGYLGKFGVKGSFASLFNRPSAVAFDREGSFWVADTGNNRIQKFSGQGAYQMKVGALGSGNGAFSSPEGIAVGPEGKIWVADTKNHRLQVFDTKGTFLQAIGVGGSGPGQFAEPAGLDFGSNGNVYVADAGNNRIQELTPEGVFVREFGSAGVGKGQLQRPVNLEADAEGLIWVLDSGNGRVQVFGEEGEFVRQFGGRGSDPTQFELGSPAGLALEPDGRLWVTDTDNHRVQKWVTPAFEASELVQAEPDVPDDPAVDVEVSEDLVAAIEGPEAGQHSYSHSGDDLVSHTGPEGETSFEYDSSGLMTKVELPNGTVATMSYDALSSRVKTVTVDPAGQDPAKTTFFSYDDENLKTTVEREGSPKVDYFFDELGAVFRMRHAVEPPEVVLSGTFWVGRETASPINTGLHNLEIQASSAHGIAAIEVMDGDTIVSEKFCSQIYGNSEIECKEESDEWVAETLGMAPGIHEIEVLVTDAHGRAASQRFWVNIPYTPPPAEGEGHRPTFAEIKRFRIDHGLDLDLNQVAQEHLLNDRIYDLLAAWGNPHTPEGEVAHYGDVNWGVPMRAVDAAELEYREWYLEANSPQIEHWGEAQRPTTYAGFVVDHAAGGIVRIGFTEGAAAAVAQMKEQLPLLAEDRIVAFTAVQGRSYASLAGLENQISEAWLSNGTLQQYMVGLRVDQGANVVRIGATAPAVVEGVLDGLLGPTAPVGVELSEREELLGGRVQAGENLKMKFDFEEVELDPPCTAGYGAYDAKPRNNGTIQRVQYLLMAAHCGPLGANVKKSYHPRGTDNFFYIGKLKFSGWTGRPYESDVAAARLEDIAAPRYIFDPKADPHPVRAAGWAHQGDELCFSGVVTGKVTCGPYSGIEEVIPKNPPWSSSARAVTTRLFFKAFSEQGDSGAPVWNKTTGKSIGILVSRIRRGSQRKWHTGVVPLIKPRNRSSYKAPGVFEAPGMGGGELDLEEAP